MPGLCALVGGQEAERTKQFGTMLARLTPYPWFRASSQASEDGHVALGTVVLDSLPAPDLVRSADGRYLLALDGELYDHPTGAADALLKGWLAEGPRFLRQLHGMFNAVIWDREARQLTVMTDRFGLKPLYVTSARDTFLVASEIKALLATGLVDRRHSVEGLAEFFAYGHFFTDRTFFDGVRTVPPATVLIYDAKDASVSESVYWAHESRREPDGDTAAKLEADLVAAVARRARPQEHLGLSLSGGLDARTLLGLMPDGLNLTSVSIGIDGSIDHRGASELARLVGIKHHAHMLDGSFLAGFETHLREMVRLTDGHYLDQGIVMPTLPTYRSLGIEYLLRGHGGELMHMSKAYSFSLDSAALELTEAELEPWLYRRLTQYMLEGVPPDLFTIDVVAASRASLTRALSKFAAVAPIDRVWPLFVAARLHRETALSMHMFGCFSTIRMPYIDNDVIETLGAMPASRKMADALQSAILAHRRPSFLNVVNSNTGARMGAGRLETEIAHFRMRVSAKLGLKGFQPYERLGLWLRQELKPLVNQLLLSDAFLSREIFRADVVKRVVAEHMDRKANRTYLLMSLIIFEMGQQMLEAEADAAAPVLQRAH